jgi:type I restriction enzyme S subunit
MSFPRYPAYKDSGVEWLGEVPEHWEVLPLKRNARLLTEKTDTRINPIALENIEGWTGKLIETETEFQGEGVAFHAGDVLFGKLRPYLAKVYLASMPGEAVGDFHVIRPGASLSSRFLQYQLLTNEVIDLVNGSTYGAKMPRASWTFLGSLVAPVPPLEEQPLIATFLDRETAKIDALIAEQQRLIELLQEKRQAVISHAVTKGLNPDAPMKDSGVEWLAEVPEHWEVKQLKFLLKELSQGCSPNCLQDPAENGQYGVLKVGCVNGIEFRGGENKALPDTETPRLESLVKAGDILMSRGNTSELVGLSAVVPEEARSLLASDLIFILRVNRNSVSPRFLSLLIRSLCGRHQIESECVGTSSSMQKINKGAIKSLLFALPPLEEQQLIASVLHRHITSNAELSMDASNAIQLLQERRSALISAAVTGQIDVRGLAEAKAEER